MGKVGTYLYFNGNTEEAFEFYRSVFGGEFAGIMRYGDNEQMMQAMGIPMSNKNLIMHITLPLLDGHNLMASDMPDGNITTGNNFAISLDPPSKEETTRMFDAIVNNGGKADIALHDSFWGSYHGSCTDRFGIQWMFDFPYQQEAP
jgi:PhnB protein